MFDDVFDRLALIRLLANIASGDVEYGHKSDEILLLQKHLSGLGFDPGPFDGVYGLLTEAAVESAFRGIIVGTPKTSFDDSSPVAGSSWMAFKDGYDLRSVAHGGPIAPRSNGRDRYIAKRPGKPVVIVLHWPGMGGGAKGLTRYMGATRDAVSTHGAIDLTGAYQLLPWSSWAYHAGWVNQLSVGIDICQYVRSEKLKDAIGEGYDVEVVQNNTGRGDSRCLSLDARLAKIAREAIFSLAGELGIPIQAPRGKDGRVTHGRVWSTREELLSSGFSGIVGHHHCEDPGRRWDIAPWWSALFDGTDAGDHD